MWRCGSRCGSTRSRVRQNFDPVPARYAGRRVDAGLGADTVEMFDTSQLVAVHEWLAGAATSHSCWTTTWTFSGSSRVRCPARPRSPEPAAVACSASITTTAPQRDAVSATRPALVPSSRGCSSHRQLPADAIHAYWADQVPIGRAGTADGVTAAALGLASAEASNRIGTAFVVDGGQSSI